MTSFYLSAMGMVNAFGSDKSVILDRLLMGDREGLQKTGLYYGEGDVYAAAVLEGLPSIPEYLKEYRSRNNQLILSALSSIKDQVFSAIETYGKNRVAVILGSSTSGILEGEKALMAKASSGNFPKTFHYIQQEIASPSLFLKEYLGLKGIHMTISTACSSSAKVFGIARNMLKCGFFDAVVVGGADSLCRLTINGFSCLDSISKNKCQPMSLNRDGINIGEGACLFLLKKDGSDEDIQLLGYGDSSDAHHISAPDPSAQGAIASMRNCLDDANVLADDIDYINMHGTGTPLNDAMESKAISSVFLKNPFCSSSKSMTGHTLGASGAMELGICWLLSSELNTEKKLIPHCWDEVVDPELPTLNLVKKGQFLMNEKLYCLSSSFAFGGNNCSLLIGKKNEE